MDRRFLGILAALIIIFGGIFLVSQNSSNKSSSSKSSSTSQATNHVKGEGQKGVTLIEYGDYQCPICEGYEPTVKQVVNQFSKDIHFQFRNLPLSQIHQNAFAAARAAEAADLQGKYWQMHDMLYEPTNWQTWTNSSSPIQLFNTYAQQIGLNVDKFKQDYSSSQINSAINADLAAFGKTGQQMATPSFFLDGRFIPNAELSDAQTGQPSVSKFAQVINAEIAKKSGH